MTAVENVPKDLEAFRREMRETRRIYDQRFAELDEKYKDDPSPRGLDDRPGADEYNAPPDVCGYPPRAPQTRLQTVTS